VKYRTKFLDKWPTSSNAGMRRCSQATH